MLGRLSQACRNGITSSRYLGTMGKQQKSVNTTVSGKSSSVKEVEAAISSTNNGQIMLRIHAKPGAKISAVTDVGEYEIGVSIGAPPRDGAANQELLDYMGKLLGLRRSELDFDKGAKSRSKILLITSDRMTLAQVTDKLKTAATQ